MAASAQVQPDRDRRRLGVSRGRAASAERAPSPARGRAGDGRHAGGKAAPRRAIPTWRRPIRTWSSPSSTPSACEGLDLVFLAMPHGAAQGIVPELRKRVGAIVDLSADFRLKDSRLYPQWYHEPHQSPELLEEFVVRHPRALPRRDRRIDRGRRRGLLSDGLGTRSRASRASRPHRAVRHHRRRGQRSLRRRRRVEGELAVLHRRRELLGLWAPRSPSHARDRAGDRCAACCSRRTSRR